MRKRHRLFKTFVRPKEYEYRQDNCSYALGASHNLDPTNNNPLEVCFSSPQEHCVTRGYMDECSPTLNASVVMSGNNRPFIVKKCLQINSMIIGKDGGNGDRQTFGIGEDGEPCPTLQTAHHHACAIIKRRKAYWIDQQGGKGGANFTEEVEPTICSDSYGTPHGVCFKKRKNPIVLNFQGSKGNNVVSEDGTCPTINSMHGHDVHVVCCQKGKRYNCNIICGGWGKI